MSHQKNLELLRNHLRNGRVSVLVGAGFSLNVSNKYLSWTGLLRDLVIDLYGEAIKLNYSLLRNSHKDLEFDSFQDQQIKNYISEKGYLALVSDYIKKKGFPEAIATYIEQRTPLAKHDNGQIILKSFDMAERQWTDERLPSSTLRLHRKLLELPWNNIYTTNYDNLLELSVDDDTRQKLDERIEKLQRDVDQKNEDTEKEIQNIMEEVSKMAESDDELGISPSVASNLKPSSHRAHMALQRIATLRQQKDEYFDDRTEQINKFNNLKDQVFSIVCHSSDLAIKGRRNIIKLHGDLRTNSTASFGFDGDYSNHYIISQEDYDSYPKKHEAFTQLMRISLLKETFCLIGFSGDDPNFTAWVSWVRDIIYRKNGEAGGTETKVFLISVSDTQLSEERKLFFHNHRICYIPLRQCLTSFGFSSSEEIGNSELLGEFLKYLAHGSQISPAKVAIELMEQEEYFSFWNSLPIILDHRKPNFDKFASINLPTHGSSNRIPAVAANPRRDNFLQWSIIDLPSCPSELKPLIGKIVVEAARSSFLPISSIVREDLNLTSLLQQSACSLQDFPGFQQLLLIDKLWTNTNAVPSVELTNTTTTADFLIYFKALEAALQLDFLKLREVLSKWYPIGFWVINKAALTALYAPAEALSILEENTQDVAQEELLNLQLQRYIRSRDFQIPKETNRRIEALKSEGLKTVGDSLDYLLNKVSLAEHKWTPHGVGKFSFGETTYSNQSRTDFALQFFGILMETGFPLSIDNIVLYDANKVYPLVNLIFQRYPFVALYFSIQISNEKILRRIGQDFAYCESSLLDLKEVSVRLERAYRSSGTPQRIKNSTLVLYSELLVAISPDEWQDFYMHVWVDKLASNALFNDRYVGEPHFITQGVKYVESLNYLIQIIENCLDTVLTRGPKGDEVISVLYNLASNSKLSEVKQLIKAGTPVYSKILSVIDLIAVDNVSPVFVLGNIHVVLENDLLELIAFKISQTDLEQLDNDRVWRIIFFFSKSANSLRDKLAASITKSKKLWQSNISAESASSHVEFIPLHQIIKSARKPDGVVFNSEQVREIFSSLKVEFFKIQEFIKKNRDVFNYVEILREMHLFLLGEKNTLSQFSDYHSIQGAVESAYFQHRGFNSILEGLESTDKSDVILALEELSIKIYYQDGIETHLDLLDVVLSKLTLQAPPALSASLIYASNWLYDFYDVPALKIRYKDRVLRLLKKLHSGFAEDIDIPTMEQRLVRFAFVLNEWRTEDDIVPHYLVKPVNGRYNNVKTALFNR